MFISRNKEIKIVDESRCFVVAEVGVNHNGSFEEAIKYLQLVKDLDADAVKFQLFKTERLVLKGAPTAKYQKKTTEHDDQFELLKSLELKLGEIEQLFHKSKEIGLAFICTPFDIKSLDFLMGLEIPFIKLSSGDFDNIFFHKKIIEKKYPVILSTGMSSQSEIRKITQQYIEGEHENFALLHCTSVYPAPVETINLSYIPELKKISKANVVGFSDHSASQITGALAFFRGAKLIEKHITLSNNLSGPDHTASLNPEKFTEYVANIRYAEAAKGTGIKAVVQEEQEVKEVVRKSLVYSRNLKAGSTIAFEDLSALRPSGGIEIKDFDKVINLTLKEDVKENDIVKLEDLT